MQLRRGHVEVIAGPMFAGKTEELIRRVRRAAIARRTVQVFTHAADTRHRSESISSHAGSEFLSTSVATAADLEHAVHPETELIGIDEAQFFSMDLLAVADRLARRGIDVVIAGLAVTFTGEPFEPMPALMSLAERADKLTAVCAVCGADAIYHQRTAAPHVDALRVSPDHIGGLELYEARCRIHFEGTPSGYAGAGGTDDDTGGG